MLCALEALLLPSSLPRISLANLGMTSVQLGSLRVLSNATEVLDWYLSFPSLDQPALRPTASDILRGVRALDLSNNLLDSQSQPCRYHPGPIR